MLTGAYKYIENLLRQVQELHYELDTESCSDDDDVSSCDDYDLSPSCTEEERPLDSNSAFEWSSASRRGRSRSRVGFGSLPLPLSLRSLTMMHDFAFHIIKLRFQGLTRLLESSGGSGKHQRGAANPCRL